MGQRAHGDLTARDPITRNPFNADCTDFLGADQSNNAFTNESSKHFPGYGAVQDQMLYRDIVVDNNASTGVSLKFTFKTAMSTGKGTTAATRTGWFEGDPLQATVGSTATAAGNFISAEAGTPANSRPVHPGDVVTVEVEGLGALTNTIVAGDVPIRDDVGAQPSESEEVVSTALGGDWEFRGVRPPRRD